MRRRPSFLRPAALRRLGLLLTCLLAVSACPPRVVHRLPPPRPQQSSVRHTVQAGETLWRISRTYGLTVEQVARANDLDPAAPLATGQQLLIPGATAVLIVPPAEPTPPVTPPPNPSASRTPLAWPLQGVLYARFGPRGEARHDGLDLAAPEGTAIRAAADGRVLFSGEQRGYGLIVIVEHAGGLLTLYAHNHENLVKDGAQVRQGEVIARVGESSRTSGPHLHFEVREQAQPQDPLKFLPPP